MQIIHAQTKFVALSTLLVALMACTPQKMIEATATEQELCIAWRDSLPTRSRTDTEQTRLEIGLSYDIQAAACPAWARFPAQ